MNTPFGQHVCYAMPNIPWGEFFLGTPPGVPLSQFTAPIVNIADNRFGRVLGARAARINQIGLKFLF